MSSKYPKQLDIFQTKRNAEFESDPNGDFVMAEDINELQDAIGAIEGTLGVNPQGNKMSVSDRITLLEGSSVLRVPPFLLYLGNPAQINGAASIGEAVSEYLKYDHVVFGNNAESWEDTDHETTALIIEEIQANRSTDIYGYIDCGVLTAGLEISEIQNRIQAWKDMGVAGIYCGNFGFEHGVDRERQNLILDSIHQHGIVAVVNGNDPAEVLSNAFNELNEGQLLPNIAKGDIYHYEGFVINTTTGEEYENFTLMLAKLEKLQGFRRELGIRILATPVITSDVAPAEADTYFEYAHAVALLASVDMFHPVIESYGETTNFNRTYSVPSVVGDWYVTDAEIVTEGNIHSRQTTFGKIAIDSVSHSYDYDGLYIPYNMLRIAANSIEGSLLKDATIEDKKIKSYDGQRLIGSINGDLSVDKININKIAAFEYGDINGAIPVDHLKANVVEAINAYIGTARINEAFIGDLTAGHIKTGTLDAERIKGSVVEAVNLYAQTIEAGSALLDSAVITELSAEKIEAAVIEAINLRAENMEVGSAVIDQAVIGELDAEKITAGDISADRIQSNVVHAINTYTDSLVANKAVIKAAAIGHLTAGHIEAEVVNAINARIGTATIDAAAIGSLEADNIKAAVISAINASIETAKIDQAQIGDLNANKITAGDIDVDRLKAAVVQAINLNAELATIDAAVIGELTAGHITSGDLDAERLAAGVVAAIDIYSRTMTAESATISNAAIGTLDVNNMKAAVISAVNASLESAKIEAAHIGVLEADHIKASVIQAIEANIGIATIDSAAIGALTADHIKAVVIDALEANIGTATIDNALIGNLTAQHISGVVLSAIDLSAETAVIDQGKIGVLDAKKITTGDLSADRMKANAISAVNGTFNNATIDSAKIGVLNADKMSANVIAALEANIGSAVINEALIDTLNASKIVGGEISADVLTAQVVNAINSQFQTAKIDAAKIGSLKAENIEAEIIKAINASIETATIDAAQIGQLKAENIQTEIIKAINASIEIAQIQAAQIEDLNASKITAGDIEAELLVTNVVKAINAELQTAVIDQAKIGVLDADKITTGDLDAERIKAGVVTAINAYVAEMVAGSAKIDSAAIGTLSVDHMQAKVISAINASIENISGSFAKIDQAKIGALTAEHIKANVVEAINLNATTAQIDEGKIKDLTAEKITTGDLKAEIMTANAITAINADLSTATIDAAQIGILTAEHIQAEIIEAINASIETAKIGNAKIDTLTADHIKTTVIEAINANITGTAKIDAAVIGSLKAENIQAEIIEAINASIETALIDSAQIGVLSAEHIKSSVVEAINLKATTAKIEAARIGNLTAGHITTGSLSADVMRTNVIFAVNGHLNSATIDAAKIGKLTTQNLDAGIITSDHIVTAGLDAEVIKTGQFHGDRIVGNSIDALKIVSGSITGREIAANTLTAREIQAGSITSEEIQVGSINAEHISTVGLDAQSVTVYNSKTGETLIGGGYLRVDGLDAGVVQSDNLAANGMFMTASSSFGNKRRNPAGEVIIGTESQVPGGNEIWKYDLDTGALVTQIDVPGKKPAFIAIDGQQEFAYITVQGDDTVVQLDLAYDTLTDKSRPMGKAPTRVKFTGDLLGDMKHLFVVNTDKTDLNAPDSFYIMDVPPHSDFSQFYIHHQIVTGNTPYDFVVSERDKKVYITLADQGDIAILDATDFPTYKWKLEGAIPIAPYGTDNYHGGMSAGFGLGAAVGGDSSSAYNKGGHAGMNHGGHGGYAVSDGSMEEYKPHGIAIDPNENLLLVTEVEHNELVIINRIDEERFDWPVHSSYTDNATWVSDVSAAIEKYNNNPELAIADGYTLVSPWVPFMGYHFANTDPAAYNEQVPNTIMYIFDTTVNQYELTGAEWLVADPTIPSPVPGEDWKMAQPSMAHYADGLMIIGVTEEEAPVTHPETGSPLVNYSAAIYGIHFFSKIQNPLGLFENFNPRLDKYNGKQPQFPPGFESYVDPNMADSNYEEYQSPDTGFVEGGSGGHAHSIETEEPAFGIQAVGHDMPGMDDSETLGPSTEGQGLIYKYLRHRVPIGDTPESIVFANGKIWVTLMGSNQIAVMNETDLYRTKEDFAQGAQWSDYIRYIEVGSKPVDMIADETRMKMYVTVQGDNKIAVVDMVNEVLLEQWAAGANVTSGDMTPDGKYLYVTNNGGVGELSFVYPDGPYIGDAFVGLEGDVQYQGGQFWTPNRTDWVFNPDGTLRSSATVEFRINEPFLNEGGYVKLSTQGLDQQYASIEQDIFNVSNFSNGNNFGEATAEKMDGTADHIKWYPNNKWITGSVSNIKVVLMNEEGQRVESIPDASTYVIHNSTGEEDPETGAIVYTTPHIEFLSGDTVPAEGWVEIDYMYRANVWFKNHNASTLLAIENSSSRNFNSFFEVDEFVPKFITIDNQQTGSFDYEPIVNPGVTNGHFKGVQYSTMTNRVALADDANFVLSAAPIGGTTHSIHDGDFGSSNYLELPSAKEEISLQITAAPTTAGNITVTVGGVPTVIAVDPAVETTAEAVAAKIRATAFSGWNTSGTLDAVTFIATTSGEKAEASYLDGGTGATGIVNVVRQGRDNQSVTIDLGGKYMIGKVKVWHFWHDQRTYHGTKTEVSEDGINWITVFDSAIEGEYMEPEEGHEIKFWGYPEKPKNYTDNFIECIPVRYIRDTINGNTVNANNHWVEIQAFGDWELDESYLYPTGSVKEGQQIATNGKGVVVTDISQASATIDLHIDFTSWWYMTYLVGPEFGSFDVEMPTVMGGSHVLPLDNPYINKVAHRHVMSWPPGMHQAVIKQRSGRVAIDRFRFEDYQYYDRSAIRIPSSADTSFTRYKIVPEQARDYVGEGNQSTHGAYDTPRVNPDTQLPDDSVSIKYRFRVKSVLDAGGVDPERGIAYLTSAIFEQGKLSSHWRPSSSSDNTPGNRIESWDGTQPHKTGIQWFHLANGAVRGAKILPSAIMDYHISPYARIGEYKLDLNHPTHRHGHMMTYADGSQYFMDNKSIIDTIMGWGASGTKNIMAREDHTHSHLMNDLMIHGKFEAVHAHGADGINHDWATINGVEVVSFKSAFDSHVGNADIHFSAAERTKLANLSTGATKVADSTTNGNILIDGVETNIYSHPTSAGNKHIPAGGATGEFLKYSASGTAVWSTPVWDDVTNKPTLFTPPTATSATLGGVKVGSGISVTADGTISWSHPTGDGQLHVPATGTGSNNKVLKAGSTAGSLSWSQVSFTELSGGITGAQHGQQGGGSLHALATVTSAGFLSAEGFGKLSGIEDNANNYSHPLTHSLDMITETTTLKVMTAAERTKLAGIATGANNYVHPATHSLDVITETADKKILSAAERTKLAGIETGAINQATADGRYLQQSGGGIADALAISGTGDATLTLNADTDNDGLEVGEPKVILKQDGGIVGAEIKLAQSGAAVNAMVLAPFMDYDTATPVKNFSVFIHDKKIWHEGTLSKSEFATAGHRHSNATSAADGFFSKEDYYKLSTVAANANNYAHPATHSLEMITETADKKVMTAAERTKLTGVEANANNYAHPATHSLSMIIETADLKVMTATERTKLSGIATNANNYVHPASHSLDIIDDSATHVKMTTAERLKLDGVETNANNYSHPATHSMSMMTETASLKVMTAAERTKLANVADNANNYAHPTGDGNLHVPATGTTSSAKVLKAGATAGSLSWSQVAWDELTGKPSVFTPVKASATTLGGIMVGDNLTIEADGRLSAQNSYVHPTGDGQKHVPADSGANTNKVLKATSTAGSPVWGSVAYSELTGTPSTFTPSTHSHSLSEVSGLDSALNARVTLAGDNTLTGRSTFTSTGVSIRIQPSAAVAGNTVLFQVNNSAGGSLVTMGTNASGESVAKMVINGDLEVTGSTVQKSTQDIQGDMNVTGNLNVTGDAVLGDDLSDLTRVNGDLLVKGMTTLGEVDKGVTAKGDLRVEGDFIPVGKYLEVGRFPVYGIAGDPQFQTEGVGTFEDIVDHLNTFDVTGMSALTAPDAGATRYYKVMLSYSSTGTEDSTLRITQGDGLSEIFSSVLPAVNGGVLNKARTWMSPAFSTTHAGDTVFQAKKNTGGALAIRYVEVIAFDYFN